MQHKTTFLTVYFLILATQLDLNLANEIFVCADSSFRETGNTNNNNNNNNNNPFDFGQLVDFGLNPGANIARYVFPDTVKGISSDLNNGYGFLSTNAQQGLNGLQSGFQTFGDNSINRLNMMQQSMMGNFMSNRELLMRAVQLLSNPQQVCQNLATQAQFAMQAAQQAQKQSGQQLDTAMNAAQEAAESMMNKMSSANPISQAQSAVANAQQASNTLFNKLGSGFPFGG